MSIRDHWLSKAPRREDLFFPVEQAFDKFFNDFFNSNPISTVKANSGYPRMNVYEADGNFTVTVSVPGMNSDNLDVEIDKNRVLTVKGQMSEEHGAPEGAQYYLRELRQSYFERKVVLPDHVAGDPVATMKDGILELSWAVTKPQPEPEVKKIAINQTDGLLKKGLSPPELIENAKRKDSH